MNPNIDEKYASDFLFSLVVLTTTYLGSDLGVISHVLPLLISFPVYAKSGIALESVNPKKKKTITSYVNDIIKL